ncbi:hypothetical protein BDV11DRAFT_143780 [Aspergillus similis]
MSCTQRVKLPQDQPNSNSHIIPRSPSATLLASARRSLTPSCSAICILSPLTPFDRPWRDVALSQLDFARTLLRPLPSVITCAATRHPRPRQPAVAAQTFVRSLILPVILSLRDYHLFPIPSAGITSSQDATAASSTSVIAPPSRIYLPAIILGSGSTLFLNSYWLNWP